MIVYLSRLDGLVSQYDLVELSQSQGWRWANELYAKFEDCESGEQLLPIDYLLLLTLYNNFSLSGEEKSEWMLQIVQQFCAKKPLPTLTHAVAAVSDYMTIDSLNDMLRVDDLAKLRADLVVLLCPALEALSSRVGWLGISHDEFMHSYMGVEFVDGWRPHSQKRTDLLIGDKLALFQGSCRGFLQRARYFKQKGAALTIQSYIRKRMAVINYGKLKVCKHTFDEFRGAMHSPQKEFWSVMPASPKEWNADTIKRRVICTRAKTARNSVKGQQLQQLKTTFMQVVCRELANYPDKFAGLLSKLATLVRRCRPRGFRGVPLSDSENCNRKKGIKAKELLSTLQARGQLSGLNLTIEDQNILKDAVQFKPSARVCRKLAFDDD